MLFDSYQTQQCDILGRFFELSFKAGMDSEPFIKGFMNSEVAAGLDKPFYRYQWMGEEYMMEELLDEISLPTGGEVYPNETLYWAGYLYRYWHFLTGESSKDIYKQADAETMRMVYLGYHPLSCEMAIEDLKRTSVNRRPKED